jgi:uncharacterized protein RhaS with RHS repeats
VRRADQAISFGAIGTTQAFNEQQNYLYDGFNRITQAMAPSWQENHGYTTFGNRYLAGAVGLPSATMDVPQSESWFSATTNRISNFSYDPMGNLQTIPGMSVSYLYDVENRQTQAVNNGLTMNYLYDGDGRRVQKQVLNGTTVQSTTTCVYDASGQLAQDCGGTITIAGTEYLSSDAPGATRLVTDSVGNVLQRMDDLPFGQNLPSVVGGRTSTMGYRNGPGSDDSQNEIPKFTGKEMDAETGLDYFGAR